MGSRSVGVARRNLSQPHPRRGAGTCGGYAVDRQLRNFRNVSVARERGPVLRVWHLCHCGSRFVLLRRPLDSGDPRQGAGVDQRTARIPGRGFLGGMRVMSKITAGAAGTITLGDLTVNRMGYGAMRLTGQGIWGGPRDPEEARRVLRRAVELDVNFIDTADSYGPEVSERLIAEALRPYPAGLVIATKGGLLRDGPDRWRADGRPGHLRKALEGSLRRLGLDRIDVYQFHRPDPAVPFQESVGELVRLKDEGKIRHIGLSNVDAEQLDQALAMTEIVSVQNRYNLSDRASERVLDKCNSLGNAFVPWFPLAASL